MGLGISMDSDSVDILFRLGAWSASDAEDIDRVPAGCEYLRNLCISNLLTAYTGRKQLC
jgi:hypothetical protein